MATPNRFSVYLGGVLVASAWSLHAAQDKLTAAVLIRAQERGSFPVEGLIYNSTGQKLAHREFPCFYTSESGAPQYGSQN